MYVVHTMRDVCNEYSKLHVGEKIFERPVINCLCGITLQVTSTHMLPANRFSESTALSNCASDTSAFNSLTYDR